MIRREQDHISSRALAQGDNRGSEGAHRSMFEPTTRLVALRTDPGSTWRPVSSGFVQFRACRPVVSRCEQEPIPLLGQVMGWASF
jgi:hypothetical protein